jgi:hypothetical protein
MSPDKYFDRYKLNAEDRRVLIELGYVPSDHGIRELGDDVWQATKVLPLAKAQFLCQHTAFLGDASKGLWD